MRYTESGDPITYFQRSSTSSNSIHCMCYNCTSLESIPDFMWIFNPALLYFGTVSTQYSSSSSSTSNKNYCHGAFDTCTSLKELPPHLFYNLYNLISMGAYISTTSTSSYYCDNWSLFEGCTSLTELPDGLFSHLPSLIYLNCTRHTYWNSSSSATTSRRYEMGSGVFENCTGLVKVGKIFKNVPNLAYTTGRNNSTNYMGIFNNCTSLEEIDPATFENLPSLTNLYYGFYNCPLLKTPTFSFKGTPNVETVTNCLTGTALEYYTIQAPAGSTTASSFSELTNVTVEEI